MKKIFILLKNFIIRLVIVALTILLSACGFTARPINYLPPQLHQLTFEAEDPYDSLTLQLKSRLVQCGATLAESTTTQPLTANSKHQYLLHIYKPTFSATETSISSSTQARVYTLLLEVNFSLHQTTNIHTAILKQKVFISRSITLGPNEIYAASNQVPITKQEMELELVNRIINILNTFEIVHKQP